MDKVLCIFDTVEESKKFLVDLGERLRKAGITVLNFSKSLTIEANGYEIICADARSTHFGSTRASGIKFLMNHCTLGEEEFRLRFGYRLKREVREIGGQQEILEILTGDRS